MKQQDVYRKSFNIVTVKRFNDMCYDLMMDNVCPKHVVKMNNNRT
jgi:hypothetical protein